jgi:GTP-binding protein EngB required for normal cell division
MMMTAMREIHKTARIRLAGSADACCNPVGDEMNVRLTPRPQKKQPQRKAVAKARQGNPRPKSHSKNAPVKRPKRPTGMNAESNPIKIAGRARELWEAEGKPEGREERHWQIAMLEAEESPRGFFERAVGFEATMDFAELLLSRYSFEKKSAAALRKSMSAIRTRASDPNLYLAVVGEFSSGKSTFINALLRCDLLKTDVLQGTTAAATFIRFDGANGVDVEFTDGSRVTPAPRNGETHRDLVHRLTAEEKFAKELRRVCVSVPACGTHENLVIIDTPGLNAGSTRHAEVTEQAVREDADAVLIVTPATASLSSVLREFLIKHLFDVLPRCAIAVTKIDHVELDERERVVSNTLQRAKMEFGLESPLVLGCCPLATVLRHSPERAVLGHRFSSDERIQHEGDFLVVEERLLAFLQTQRHTILAEKLARLLEKLLQPLAEELDRREGEHRERHETLEKNRVPDFKAFAAAMKNECRDELAKAESSTRGDFADRIAKIKEELKRKISSAVKSAPDIDALNAVAKVRAPELCTATAPQMEKLLRDAGKDAVKLTKKLHQRIANEFHALFQSLAPLGIDTPPAVVAGLKANLNAQSLHHHLIGVNSEYADINDKTEKAIGAGGLAGGIAGQLLIPIPVVGFLIGAVFGGVALNKLAGFFFQPDIGDLRSKYRAKLSAGVDDAFQKAAPTVAKSVSKIFTQARNDVAGVLDRYRCEYGDVIKRLADEDAAASLEVAALRELVSRDRAEIASRLDRLGRVKARSMRST